jgi:hypothetical protein
LSFILFYRSPFLTEKPLLLSRESLGEASQGFILDFNFFQLLLPFGPLALSSHKARYNPYELGKPNARTKEREDERENDGKW